MQRLNKKIFGVIIALVALLPVSLEAQTLTSSVNTYSPYSMYGLGELSTQGTAVQRSMGGVGVAMFSTTSVNVMNPAAYGYTPQQSFLFNFGVEGGHFRNSQNKYGETTSQVKTAYNSVNIHDIAFQMPLAKGVGLGFSLTPYSNVGYTMHRDDMSVAGNMGSARYEYYGEGDVSEVKLGVGYAPVKKFSMGVAMMYYWGCINRSYKMLPSNIITGNGEYASTTGIDTYDVSRVKMQAGVMWNPILKNTEILSFAATYDIGGNLHPDVVKYVYVDNLLQSVVRQDSNAALPMKLPKQVASLYSMMFLAESFQTLRLCSCLSTRSRIASFQCIDFGFISRRCYQRNYQTCGTSLSVHEAYFGSPHPRKSLPVVACTSR